MYHRKSDPRLTTKLKNLSVKAVWLPNNNCQQKFPPRRKTPLLQTMPDFQSPATMSFHTSLPAFHFTAKRNDGPMVNLVLVVVIRD